MTAAKCRTIPGIALVAGCGAAMFLAACATPGVPNAEAADAFPKDYKTDILAMARQYADGSYKIKDAGISEPVLKKLAQGERYVVCARFNPAGADGKYLGMKGGVGIFWFGKLDQVAEIPMEPEARQPGMLPDLANPCSDAIYQPFPEAEKLAASARG
jgi:hypothetical protein